MGNERPITCYECPLSVKMDSSSSKYENDIYCKKLYKYFRVNHKDCCCKEEKPNEIVECAADGITYFKFLVPRK